MSVLRNRSYLILFLGQWVSSMGNNLFSIALPWYVLLITGSKTALAVTGFTQSIPVIFGLFAGVFVDRWGKKMTLIWSDTARALLSLLLFGLALTGKPSFLIIVILVLLLQVVGTVFNPASAAILPLILDGKDIPAATGLEQSSGAAASLAGQLGGGVLLSIIGAPLLFLSNAVSFVVSVFSLCFIRTKPEHRTQSDHRPKAAFWKDWKQGMAVIFRSKLILRITLAGMLVNFAGAPLDIVWTAWVKYVLHGSGYMLGLFATATLVGVILGGGFLGFVSKRLGLARIMMTCLLFVGALVIAFGLAKNLYWDLLCLFLSGIGQGILNGALSAMVIQHIPQQLMGRVIGTLGSAISLANPLGMAVIGALMVLIPLPLVFTFSGICCIIGGCFFIRKVDNDLQHLADVQTM